METCQKHWSKHDNIYSIDEHLGFGADYFFLEFMYFCKYV